MKNEFITITLSNGEKQSFAFNLKKLELKDNSSIENLDWPENVKSIQKNWIGKSFGSEIKFSLQIQKQY